MSDRNIIITGFMGTGKTTVGQLVAQMTGRTFVDTDEAIEQHAGLSIPEIFARDGEQGFRLLERRLARYLGASNRLVIATGGGMLVDQGNREMMLASGFVVCLNATREAIYQRLSGSTDRPLLNGDWQTLLEERRRAYAAIPYQVDTTDKAPDQIAQEILLLWQNAFE